MGITTDAGGICTNNIFSSPFIDSGNTNDETINGTGSGTPSSSFNERWIVERNINQTDKLTLRPGSSYLGIGTFGSFSTATGPNPVSSSRIDLGIGNNNNTPAISCVRVSADNAATIVFSWLIPLFGCVPENVKIITASFTFTPSVTPNGTSTGTIIIRNSTVSDPSASITNISSTGATVTLTTSATFRVVPRADSRLETTYTISDSTASDITTTIDGNIVYRW